MIKIERLTDNEMKPISEQELESIKGGTSISGTIINALVNVIKELKAAGYSFGSGIRRLAEGNVCPLK